MNCCTPSTSHHSTSIAPTRHSPPVASNSPSSWKTSARIAAMSAVTEYLYLSSARSINYANISKHKITHIVNATIEVPIIHLNGIKTIRIPVNDKLDEQISRYFDDVADFIDGVVTNNGRVLIHCMAGISRSAAFVLAYLMKYKRMSLRDAYHYLHKKRSVVRPNGSFFRQLIDYEWKLFRKTSVKMVYLDSVGVEVPDLFASDYKKMVLLEAIVSRTRQVAKAATTHASSPPARQGSRLNLINC